MDLREARARQEIKRHPWELARFEVMLDIITQHFSPQQKIIILDVGCGDTFFVENLAQRLPNALLYGIDIEFQEEDLIYYKEKFEGTPIQIYDSLENMETSFPYPKADVVLLLDVIEHIEDDVAFLKMLYAKPYITEATKFFVTVPAFQSLYTTHDDFLGHYRRYNNASLKQSLTQANQEVKQIGYFFAFLLPIRWLKALKERFLTKDKASTGLVEWSKGERATLLMKQILILDYQTTKFFRRIGIKLPGLSNFSVSHPKKGR